MTIVVFDSGFGSLSIIREIQKKFKGELIYLADQKNFPYGTKSKPELEQIIKKLENQKKEIYGFNQSECYINVFNVVIFTSKF